VMDKSCDAKNWSSSWEFTNRILIWFLWGVNMTSVAISSISGGAVGSKQVGQGKT